MNGILIAGTGAMALLFGGKFAAAGEKVTFLGTWDEGIQAINQNGIRIVQKGKERVYPATAVSDPDQVQGFVRALVLVKSWQTERTAESLHQALGSNGVVLTLQNGIGNLEILQSRFGNNGAFQGVTTYGATLLGPGIVKPAGEGIVSLQDLLEIQPFQDIFDRCDIQIQIVSELSKLIWSKLAINVAINPLTALLEIKNGDLVTSEEVLLMMEKAAAEVRDVARAQGVELDYSDPGEAAKTVALATGENLSSMLQDVRRGAVTEIDTLCGAVVDLGKRYQVPTPVNEVLLWLIRSKVDLVGGKIDADR